MKPVVMTCPRVKPGSSKRACPGGKSIGCRLCEDAACIRIGFRDKGRMLVVLGPVLETAVGRRLF
jgi:hypothetical protein